MTLVDVRPIKLVEVLVDGVWHPGELEAWRAQAVAGTATCGGPSVSACDTSAGSTRTGYGRARPSDTRSLGPDASDSGIWAMVT
jgi:hypothetical protein